MLPKDMPNWVNTIVNANKTLMKCKVTIDGIMVDGFENWEVWSFLAKMGKVH
jgi:U3 small nucleolar ribonucleoprotein component